jgi:ATPase AAA-2 domain protein
MLNQFTDEYKQIMLDAENRAKKFGHKNILPEDVLLQISRLTKGNIAELLQTLGVNESLILDIFSRPPFLTKELENRDGDYIGISERLRELIVASLRMAASFHKPKAGVEDFLLALIQSPDEKWFVEFLDFVGVNVNMFERQVTNFNHLASPQGMKNFPMNNQDPIFGPIDEIMDMIEDHFGNQNPNINQPMDTPFAHNAPQEKNESRTPALDFFGTDLVAEAKTNKLDPVIGRNTEIDRLISILNRKTKNNPCLVGEPGVGKTAVVEGLARRIASGDVPFAMQNKRIVMLDLPGMLAGTKYRGEFENRIKMIIEEASTLENEVILFIDEIHTIIGAGSSEGTMDAANILKPAMARGKISLIGATTLSEYQKYIEKDSALERRFQKVDVGEPTQSVAKEIILGLRQSFEDFHNLIIEDSAISDAVELSSRYITDRFLPDKAIDLLDEACSAKSMTYNFVSSEAQEIKEKIEKLEKESVDMLMSQQYAKGLAKKREQEQLLKELESVKKKHNIPRKDRKKITGTDVQKILHQITGIPLKNLQKEDLTRLKNLDKSLKKHIIGQDEAIDAIVSSLKRSSV